MQVKIFHTNEISDKLRTRRLYESCFDEGKDDFIDYYYTTIINRNEIAVIEDDNEIISMIHLNPYYYNICGEVRLVHYLVGIATDTRYRNKGYMGQLITFATNYLNELNEPFCYLVPDNSLLEKAYSKYGFERVCDFTIDKFLDKKYDIYPEKNAEYLELMKREQEFLDKETDEYKSELSKKIVMFKTFDNGLLKKDEYINKKIYVCQEV